MNRSGGEAFARLAQQLNRARLQASGGGGGKGGGGMPGGFKGFMAGGGLLAVLAGGGLILNYSLFNGKPTVADVRHSTNKFIVDGGHRAIKYSRLHGVRSDIFPEGTHLVVCPLTLSG
jgi:prohibitin 2